MVNKNNTKVLNHFENLSGVFDNIYKGEGNSILYKIVDILFRKDILEHRLKLILNFSGDVSGKDILDIGCGPGRYAVGLAKGSPKSVLGVDISPLMIDLAKKLALTNGVAEICKFQNCDFLQKEFNAKFDIIIAAGVFDYIPNPKIFLSKIKKILRKKAILSFPVKWTIFTPVRMAWLHKRGCPNYYYTKEQIKGLIRECGLRIDSIHKIGSFLVPGNYIVVCNP